MAEGQFYYCLKHHAVEPYDGCRNEDRLGPYATADDAAHALQTVEANNDKWDAEDRAEREDEDGDADANA